MYVLNHNKCRSFSDIIIYVRIPRPQNAVRIIISGTVIFLSFNSINANNEINYLQTI